MHPTLIGALIGATVSILGVLVTLWWNTRAQRINIELHARIEREKRDDEYQRSKESALILKAERAHKIACILGREFSITGLNIDYTASMTPAQWDAKYKLLCDQSDELIMIADIFLPSIRQSAETLYGHMNNYWGNFKLVLNRSQAGHGPDPNDETFAEVHEYARLITSLSAAIKTLVSDAVNTRNKG
jgi:hypothetical protein